MSWLREILFFLFGRKKGNEPVPVPRKITVESDLMSTRSIEAARKFLGSWFEGSLMDYYSDRLLVISGPDMSLDVTVHRVFVNPEDTKLGSEELVETLNRFKPTGGELPSLKVTLVYVEKGGHYSRDTEVLVADVEYGERGIPLAYTEAWVRTVLKEQTGNDRIQTQVLEWTDIFSVETDSTVGIIGLDGVKPSELKEKPMVLVVPSEDILLDVYEGDMDIMHKCIMEYLSTEGFEDLAVFSDEELGVPMIVVNLSNGEADEENYRKVQTIIQTVVKQNFYHWKKKDPLGDAVARLAEAGNIDGVVESATDQLQDKQ